MPKTVSIDPQLFNRRHPTYDGLKAHWDFVEQTYHGGRQWFANNVFKYHREGDTEYEDRVKRSYRFNHTREVVDMVTKYVFKAKISRSEDAPEELREFWKKATKGGEDVNVLMRYVDRAISLYGQPYIVVDNNATPVAEGKKLTIRQVKAQKARTYAYVVRPQDVLDVSYDDFGDLNWILMHEINRDDADFFETDHHEYGCYRLFTRTESILYRIRLPLASETGGAEVVIKPIGVTPFKMRPSAVSSKATSSDRYVIEEMSRHTHGLGQVPVIPVRDRESDSVYHAPGLVDDIAYLDRAVANYLSNLDAIIQDQTFSTLVIPAQALPHGSDEYSTLVELGTKRIFAYDGEGGGAPAYISPDPRQAQMILEVVTKIITEIYHSVGMAGERTKMDNSAGIDNSSGVAKSYDFDRMNTMLKSKADRLTSAENKIARMVMAWNGKTVKDDPVKYSDDFDTRGLYDEFDVANRLTLLGAPEELRRYQFLTLIDKLFPNLKKDLREKIEKELEEWPESEEVDVTSTKPTPGTLKDQRKPEADNRQGQGQTP